LVQGGDEFWAYIFWVNCRPALSDQLPAMGRIRRPSGLAAIRAVVKDRRQRRKVDEDVDCGELLCGVAGKH
jgi:hypothetical protein